MAETLDEFRGNYRYNLLDDNVRRFNTQVPRLWQWDDHETTNTWSPGKQLDARYQVRDIQTTIRTAPRFSNSSRSGISSAARSTPAASGRMRWMPPSAPRWCSRRRHLRPNSSPLAGYQFFGEVEIDGRSGVLTVTLRDLDGVAQFRQPILPHGAA